MLAVALASMGVEFLELKRLAAGSLILYDKERLLFAGDHHVFNLGRGGWRKKRPAGRPVDNAEIVRRL